MGCGGVLGSKPTSERVCEHALEIAHKEGRDNMTREKCDREIAGVKEKLGTNFDRWASCVLDAKTGEEIVDRCDPDDYEE